MKHSIVLIVLLLTAAQLFAMAKAPVVPVIDIISHTGVIKITKPYGGSITIGPDDRIPSFIPIGSRIEVISGYAEIMIGDDTVKIERGEVIHIWGDEMSGSVDFTIIPFEPDAILEPAEKIVEEVSPSTP